MSSSLKVFNFLNKKLISEVEEFWVLALDAKKNLISCEMLFRGTVDSCFVHPRDIFRFACIKNASCIIVSHNHPSLDPSPSIEDIRLTRQIFQVSKIIGISLIDHLIITPNSYRSFADQGWGPYARNKRTYRMPPP